MALTTVYLIIKKYGKATYTNLLARYGYTFSEKNDSSVAGSLEQNNYNLTTSPFYFTKAGAIHDNALNGVGNFTNNWTATLGTELMHTFFFRIAANAVQPSYDIDRGFFSFSVRCVAR